MEKMRIELCKDKAEADKRAALLGAQGFTIRVVQPYRYIWVTIGDGDPMPFADVDDNEVWAVIGEK
jgi:hypothetical protein